MKKTDYDIAIIGGGVAGLSAAILLSQKGYDVILFEKNKFPFHKVCGEYVSLESAAFLKSIGFDYNELRLPVIKKLKISSGSSELKTNLPLGGIGVSRYFLDNKLMNIAKNSGATVKDNTTIFNIAKDENTYVLASSVGEVKSRVVLGAYGKRSNLDDNRTKADNNINYIGIKYHVEADLPDDQIELHIFKHGYCGISKVEGINKYCLCYMTTAKNLNMYSNSIHKMEAELLSSNKYLKRIFNNFNRLIDAPITISQLKFGQKDIIKNNIIMLGDAAGSIAPLCGNGMSMAFHSSYIACSLVDLFLKNKISYTDMLVKYKFLWEKIFQKRIIAGNYLQKLFLNQGLSELALAILAYIPSLHTPLIRLTHGKEFFTGNYSGIPVK